MKKLNNIKNERGAIMVMTAIVLTVILGFTALSIDIGLHYYCGAKLQNAVDAAGTAVASNIGSADGSLEDIAYEYLAKNGYDVNGKYKDKMTVKIEQKGVLNQETITNEDEYITTGYYKITVDVDDSTFFANILDIKALHLQKTAFVRCKANYVDMPRALKYTVFAGSTNGTEQNPALQINGRTGGTLNEITASFEGLINGINGKIVQPIIGIFGGEPNYNSLVNINLSEVITNGDVHSNSNISIGVQALNASRVKDQDYDNIDNNSNAYDEMTKETDNTFDDYGQVTYTAVDNILFNSSLKENHDDSTHLYVQNQQFLEQTQTVLNIINQIDFSQVSSTLTLQNKYTDAANVYFEKNNVTTVSQQEAIIAQAQNLVYNDDGTYSLNNQSSIVYDISQYHAEQMLASVRNIGLYGLVEELEENSTDSVYGSGSNLLFANVADTAGTINYSIQFNKYNDDNEIVSSQNLTVAGVQVNRDTSNIYAGINGVSMNPATETGAKFAIARTFQEQSEYISVPNMKPYFTRQVNQSIRNATKTQEELGDSEATGSRTVKEAVKNMSNDLTDLLNGVEYTDDTYASDTALTSAETSPLFTYSKASASASLIPLTGNAHTTFKGENLYDDNGVLRNASSYIDEFKTENIDNTDNYGIKAVEKYYNQFIADNTDSGYETKYAKDIVDQKKASIQDVFVSSYDDKLQSIKDYENNNSIPPKRTDVFLGPNMDSISSIIGSNFTSYKLREEYDSKMNYSLRSSVPMPIVSGNTVTMAGEATWADGSTGAKTISGSGSSGTTAMAGKYFASGNSVKNASATVYAATSDEAIALVAGDMTVYRSSIIYSADRNIDVGNSGGSAGAPATLIVTGNMSILNQLQIRDNSVVYCFGNIDMKSLYLATNARLYCAGNVTISGTSYIGPGSSVVVGGTISMADTIELDENASMEALASVSISTASVYSKTSSLIKSASVTIGGSDSDVVGISCSIFSTGDITFNSKLFTYEGSVIKAKGNLTLNGDKDYRSIEHSGEIYVTGDVNSLFVMYFDSGDMYCCGSVYGSNTTNTSSSSYNALQLENDCNVYIGGCLGSKSTKERHVYINSGTGSVLSVYGLIKTGTLTYSRYPFYNIVEFCNNQSGSTVYIGDGRLLESDTIITQSFSNAFLNKGTMYCYVALNVTNSASFEGSGLSWFRSNLTVTNNTISISQGHTLICDDTVTCASLSATQNSKCYAINALNMSSGSGKITVSSVDNTLDSTQLANVFLGPNSTITAGISLDIDGFIYLPERDQFNFATVNIRDDGSLLLDCPLYITGSMTVDSGGFAYVSGLTTITNCNYTNNGISYLMGGVDTTNSNGSTTVSDIAFGAGSETFIGNSGSTLTYKGYFDGNGNIYIDSDLSVNNYSKSLDYVSNRGEALLIRSGNTYVSGSVNIQLSSAIYVAEGCSFSCFGDFNYGAPIYNLGTFVVLGNLTQDMSGDFSDRSTSMLINETKYDRLRSGYSICNGGKSGTTVPAVMYVGGDQTVAIGGSMLNFGYYFQKASMNIGGYLGSDDNNYNANIALFNEPNSVAHFGGNVTLNSDAACNLNGAVFSCQGELEYGDCLINAGEFIAIGKVTFNASGQEVLYSSTNNFSVRNGWTADDTRYYDAVLYLGSGINIGKDEPTGWGGAFQNFATAYINGDLNIYPNADHAYKYSSFLGQENSKTFIGGSFFSSEATAIMTDTMFLCDGNFLSKRCTKVNMNQQYNDVDSFTSSYVYVGGNMIANKSGLSIDNSGHTNSSADFDVYSNSNIYVGGTLYANCIVCLKQNVVVAVDGKTELTDEESRNRVMNIIEQGAMNLTGIDTSKFRFFANQFDQSGNQSQANKFIVRGSGYVDGTFKFRDMCKGYFYGDFICSKFAEIGKVLDETNLGDNTAAMTDAYKCEGDSDTDYKYANAGYFYVGGDFYTGGYNKIYAGTTMRVKGDYVSNKYLTLRHDATIYVGKKLKVNTSIDGGSYSDFYVAGSMQASTSFIKIRDCATVFVGGNLTALSYIELGKAGDYVRGEKGSIDDGGEGSDDGTGGGDNPSQAGEEAITDTNTIDTEQELASDSSDTAKGSVFYIGKNIISYNSYIKEFAYSRIAAGGYVFTPKYLTLRHNSDLWVMPETFNNSTFVKKSYVSSSDGTVLGDLIDSLKELGFNIVQTFSPKNGSVYSLGELTLNKNASLMGTYDTVILGQCVLRQDSLVYMGNDFSCSASNVNISIDSIVGNTSIVGFDSYGTTSVNGLTFPVVVYADNNINISTTVSMKLTYLVANRGDVNLYDIYSKSENAENNAKQLPNAVCSYRGDINYFAMYGKIGAMFYAPNGTLDLDGYYSEIWGSCIGDTVEMNAYYLGLHRFTNWRTLQLNIVESGSVYLISEAEYEEAENNVDDIYMFDPNATDNADLPEGARPFF
ncbi:MAG: pilus assembly protein TadG-related protein [Eubacterium sp.]